jgi:hypothetical protein
MSGQRRTTLMKRIPDARFAELLAVLNQILQLA